MLTKSLGLCLLAIAMPRPAAPQTSPDMQKIIERLDKLEDENHKLLDEIHELRNELAQRDQRRGGARDTAPADERLAVQESRTADLDQSKVAASQRFPISLTGMLLFNAFENGRSGGGREYPVTASLAPVRGDRWRYRSARRFSASNSTGPIFPAAARRAARIYMDFFGGTSAPDNNLLAHSHRHSRSDLEEHDLQRRPGQADHLAAGTRRRSRRWAYRR